MDYGNYLLNEWSKATATTTTNNWTQPPGIAVSPDQEKTLLALLLILLERAGGRITVSAKELREAAGHIVLSEEDAAGLRHIDLVPDYVAIDPPPPTLKVKYTTVPVDNTTTLAGNTTKTVAVSQAETDLMYSRVQERLQRMFSDWSPPGLDKRRTDRGRQAEPARPDPGRTRRA